MVKGHTTYLLQIPPRIDRSSGIVGGVDQEDFGPLVDGIFDESWRWKPAFILGGADVSWGRSQGLDQTVIGRIVGGWDDGFVTRVQRCADGEIESLR